MNLIRLAGRKALDTLQIYWELMRIVVPVTLATQLLSELGVIAAIAPALSPVMALFGLPADLGLAWLTAMLVGIWSAVPLIFVLVDPASLTVADITIFSSLILFAHGLPIEQKIIQKAGPGFIVTTLLRVLGGALYAAILHQICTATGWLSEPLHPTWMPMSGASDWPGFFLGLIETLFWMLIILVVLAWGLDFLKHSGLMTPVNRALDPVLGLSGIRAEARPFTAIGLFLGISYGGGLLIREARTGSVSPRQVFAACVFMGFAHGIIEDTLIVMALGADFAAVFLGRIAFAMLVTALIIRLLRHAPDDVFFSWLFARRQAAGS